MNHADLGGQRGHGPVRPEPEGALWHAPWEPRVLAVTLAAGATGAWNIDMSRAARETLPDYAGLSYYEVWLQALEKLLAERALVTAEERRAARLIEPPLPLPRCLRRGDVAATLARGAPTQRPGTGSAPRFAVGARVRTRSEVVSHHTRLPGYARGRSGVIEAVHGRHVFADTHALGLGEQPQWLYTVAFAGASLWGDDGAREAGLVVSIDAWEPYLQPADAEEDAAGRAA